MSKTMCPRALFCSLGAVPGVEQGRLLKSAFTCYRLSLKQHSVTLCVLKKDNNGLWMGEGDDTLWRIQTHQRLRARPALPNPFFFLTALVLLGWGDHWHQDCTFHPLPGASDLRLAGTVRATFLAPKDILQGVAVLSLLPGLCCFTYHASPHEMCTVLPCMTFSNV